MNNSLGGLQALNLILGLAGRRVVAEVAANTEILPSLPWVRVPGLKPWIRGVAVHQSELLPVVDLSCLLDAQPLTGSAEKNRIISVGSGGFRTGFLVASVDTSEEAGDPGGPPDQDLESLRLDELCLNLLADPRANRADSVPG